MDLYKVTNFSLPLTNVDLEKNKDRKSLLKWPQEVTSFLERHSNEQQKP